LAEQNLYLFSQLFTNATYWSVNGTTLGTLTTAPDGTTTAYPLNEGTTNGYHDLETQVSNSVTVAAGLTYTLSAFAQNVSGTYFVLAVSGSGYAGVCFNISTGAFVTSINSGNVRYISSSITQVGSSTWYRCSLTFSSATTQSLTGRFAPSNTTTLGEFGLPPPYTGTNNSINVWGAQLEQRSAVTAYTPTTTAAITNYIPVLLTAPVNESRFDHNPVTRESLGLLIEEQRTNLVLRSQEFDNAYWLKANSTISTAATIAPDGTQTAQKLVETTSNSDHAIDFASTLSVSNATPYTYTTYLKSAGRTWAYIYATAAGSNTAAWFNLATGVVGTRQANNTSATMTAVGNGWYRCSITWTTVSTGAAVRTSATTGDNVVSYTGNGFDGLYIWGAQFEASSFFTSYIPTVASQVTRSPDVATMTGTNFSSWFTVNQGTFYAESAIVGAGSANTILAVSAGSSYGTGNGMLLRNNNGTVIQAGGNATATNLSGSYGAGVYTKQAFNYNVIGVSNNTLVLTANGVSPVTLSTLDYTGVGTTYFIIAGLTPFQISSQRIKKIAYYPTVLTNTNLQSLTGS
jgi:hypothetical protein